MLYVANNGEACKDTLCQHPECWQSNVRRVREAVRQRNGIPQQQNVNTRNDERFDEKKRQEMESKLLRVFFLLLISFIIVFIVN